MSVAPAEVLHVSFPVGRNRFELKVCAGSAPLLKRDNKDFLLTPVLSSILCFFARNPAGVTVTQLIELSREWTQARSGDQSGWEKVNVYRAIKDLRNRLGDKKPYKAIRGIGRGTYTLSDCKNCAPEPHSAEAVSGIRRLVKAATSNCPLFQKFAEELLHDLVNNGRFEVTAPEKVHDWLEFLYCELEIVQVVYATSCGEIDEWLDEDHFWATRYGRIQRDALSQGKKIERIFIIKSEEDRERGERLFATQAAQQIKIKLISWNELMPKERPTSVENCLIFCDVHETPVYGLTAHHNGATLKKVVLYRNNTDVEKLVKAYRALSHHANLYAHGKPKGRAKPLPVGG